MNLVHAETESIVTASQSIEEAAEEARALSAQVLATAEGINWQGRANAAFQASVDAFKDQKDRLDQALNNIGGNVNTASVNYDATEDASAAAFNGKIA